MQASQQVRVVAGAGPRPRVACGQSDDIHENGVPSTIDGAIYVCTSGTPDWEVKKQEYKKSANVGGTV